MGPIDTYKFNIHKTLQGKYLFFTDEKAEPQID